MLTYAVKHMFTGGLSIHSYIALQDPFVVQYVQAMSLVRRDRDHSLWYLAESRFHEVFCMFGYVCVLMLIAIILALSLTEPTPPKKQGSPPLDETDRGTKRKVLYIAESQPLRLVER